MHPDVNVADIIKAAASSTLGVLSLLVIAVAALALAFFKDAREGIRVAIFMVVLIAAVVFGMSLLSSAGGSKEQSPSLSPSPIASATVPTSPPKITSDTSDIAGRSTPVDQQYASSPSHKDKDQPASQEKTIQDKPEEGSGEEGKPSISEEKIIKFEVGINRDWCADVRGSNFGNGGSCRDISKAMNFHVWADGTELPSWSANLDGSRHLIQVTATNPDASYNMRINGSCDFYVGPNNENSFFKVTLTLRNTVMRNEIVEYAIESCSVI